MAGYMKKYKFAYIPLNQGIIQFTATANVMRTMWECWKIEKNN